MDVADNLNQFSDRLSPVFVRDIRQGLRAHYFIWAFILFQIVALLATLAEVSFSHLFNSPLGGVALSGILQIAFSLGFGLVLPLSLFAALQPEIGKGRNIELLLASNLTRWQIVWGKFLVASALSGLLIISLTPYLLLRYFLGSVELLSILGLVSSTYLANMAMNAIVIGASGYLNPVGRVFAIFYFCMVHNLTVLGSSARAWTSGSLTGSGGFLGSIGIVLASAVIIILSLQLGRARIKLFEDPLDPPSTAGVFAIAFLVPIANGISVALGGSMASFLVLCLLIGLSLMIDRGPGKKSISSSIRLQP